MAAAKRSVGRPPQITMEQINAAALEIGLDKLTLLGVAKVLGVTPAALYRHVDSREDLVARFVADVTEQFPIPGYQGEGWADWASRFARSLLDMYTAVPGLADYTLRKTHVGQSVLHRHETSIRAARESGFAETEALYATRAIIEFVAAWVARSQRRDVSGEESAIHPDLEFRQSALAFDSDQYPGVKSSLRAVLKDKRDPLHRFDFTLDALIAGLMSRRGNPDLPPARLSRKPAR